MKVYDNEPKLRELINKIEDETEIQDDCMICYGENLESVKLDNCEHYLCIDCFIELVEKPCPYCRQ